MEEEDVPARESQNQCRRCRWQERQLLLQPSVVQILGGFVYLLDVESVWVGGEDVRLCSRSNSSLVLCLIGMLRPAALLLSSFTASKNPAEWVLQCSVHQAAIIYNCSRLKRFQN